MIAGAKHVPASHRHRPQPLGANGMRNSRPDRDARRWDGALLRHQFSVVLEHQRQNIKLFTVSNPGTVVKWTHKGSTKTGIDAVGMEAVAAVSSENAAAESFDAHGFAGSAFLLQTVLADAAVGDDLVDDEIDLHAWCWAG